MTNARIVNGAIVPNIKLIMQVLTQVSQDLQSNPSKQTAFRTNPRGYLARAGLNADIQNEVLLEMGLNNTVTPEDGCNIVSCVCTDCCVTCWIGSSI